MSGIFNSDIDPQQSLSGAKMALLSLEEEQAEHDRRRDIEFLEHFNMTYQDWKSRSYRNAQTYGFSEEDIDPDL